MPHRLLIALLALSLLAVACGGSGDDAPPPAEQPAEPAPREPTDLSPQPAVAVVPDVPGPSADLPDANATDEQAAPFVFEFPAEPPVPDELVTFTVSATDAADPAQTPTRVTFLSSSLDPVFVELSPVASSTRAWVGEARFPSSGAWQALISTPDDTIVGPSIVISADLRPSVAGAPPPHFLFEPPALTLTAPLDVRDWPADDEPIASTLEPGASIQIIGRTEDAAWLWLTVDNPESIYPSSWGWASAISPDLTPAAAVTDSLPPVLSPGVWVASTDDATSIQPTFGDFLWGWTAASVLDVVRRDDVEDTRLHFDPTTGLSTPAPPPPPSDAPLRKEALYDEEPAIAGGLVIGLVDQAGNVLSRVELAPSLGRDSGNVPYILELSPDGEALLVYDPDNLDLWSDAGAAIRVLLPHEPPRTVAYGHSPAWTPDGDILYSVQTSPSGPVTGFRLRRVDRAGAARPLTDEISGFRFLQSPDGALIATDLGAIANRDGVLLDTLRSASALDWSDDGRFLAYATERTGQIFIYDSTTATATRIFDGDDDYTQLDLAPDGRHIALAVRSRGTFFATHIDRGAAVVHILSTDGSLLQSYLSGNNADFDWFPDSRWLAIDSTLIFN